MHRGSNSSGHCRGNLGSSRRHTACWNGWGVTCRGSSVDRDRERPRAKKTGKGFYEHGN